MKLLQLVNRTILALVVLVCFSFNQNKSKEIIHHNDKKDTQYFFLRVDYNCKSPYNKLKELSEIFTFHILLDSGYNEQGHIGYSEIWKVSYRTTPPIELMGDDDPEGELMDGCYLYRWDIVHYSRFDEYFRPSENNLSNFFQGNN